MKGTGSDRFQLDHRSLALGGILGALLGAGGGYLVARRALGAQFDARLNAEVSSVKAHYNSQLKSLLETGRPYAGPVRDTGTADARSDEGSGIPGGDAGDIGEPEPDALEGFDDGSELDELEGIDGDDQAASSQPVRSGLNGPYIISAAEFGESEIGWQQLSITWYDGDKVLVDDKEEPIRDISSITGTRRIVKSAFGGKSGDPNTVLVRNPRLEIDFEIKWDDRSYVDAVLNYGKPP